MFQSLSQKRPWKQPGKKEQVATYKESSADMLAALAADPGQPVGVTQGLKVEAVRCPLTAFHKGRNKNSDNKS